MRRVILVRDMPPQACSAMCIVCAQLTYAVAAVGFKTCIACALLLLLYRCCAGVPDDIFVHDLTQHVEYRGEVRQHVHGSE
jgi:hypothetical protein